MLLAAGDSRGYCTACLIRKDLLEIRDIISALADSKDIKDIKACWMYHYIIDY